MNRVQILEEQMAEMKVKEVKSLNESIDEEDDQDEVTRSQARDKAISIIKSRYSEFIVEKASRRDGSGIKIHTPNSKKPIFIKFFHSKEHHTGDLLHGWHVVRLDDVIGTAIDFCLFSYVDSSNNWSFFLFSQDEIGMYYDNHRPNSGNDILHLYFVVKDGKAIEVRESTVDISSHLNNWHILNNI